MNTMLNFVKFDSYKNRRKYNTYVCDCGTKCVLRENSVKTGNTRSCGCLKAKKTSNRSTTHGMSKTKTYKTWKSMRRRCYNKNNSDYYLYGAKGVKVCDSWNYSFINFYNDMGDPPSNGHSIDRIDSNGDYELENCRWATTRQQQINRSCSIVYKGEMASEASLRLGGSIGLVGLRINRLGWSKEKAFTTLPRKIKK